MSYIYDLTDTWNASGTVFNGIKLNVTNSASAAASKLVTLQIGGTEHFSVTKAGVGYFSGNVGIGTSSPSAKLQVNGGVAVQGVTFPSSGAGLEINWDGTQSVLQSYSRTASAYQPLWLDGSFLRFNTSSVERMRIDSSGNLLVGTTSATGRSGVSSRFVSSAPSGFDTSYFLQTTNTSFAIVSHVNTTSGTRYHVGFGDGTTWTERGSISTNGTGTSYNTSSDYRLKNIDGPIVNSGAYIDALNPVQGSWKADGSRFIGLLAHEAQEVSETPIATGEKDGEKMQAMDYSAPEIIANLIAEIQSLRARVAQLEGN